MKKKIKKLVVLYDFYWSSKNMLPYFDNPKCFIVFHLDREELTLKDKINTYLRMWSIKSKIIEKLIKFLVSLYHGLKKPVLYIKNVYDCFSW